jgi:hypothetical protein
MQLALTLVVAARAFGALVNHLADEPALTNRPIPGSTQATTRDAD